MVIVVRSACFGSEGLREGSWSVFVVILGVLNNIEHDPKTVYC
jgi:hypothetical protein